MFLAMAGAMSTAEIGLSLAEMIRQGKVHGISCTGANLEEDVFNLVAHDHYVRVPNYRDLTPADEQALLDRQLNRVTDTCIPEEEAMRRIEGVLESLWQRAQDAGERFFPHEYFYQALNEGLLEEHYQIDPADSWMVAAAERNLPLFVPGWEDSTLGNIFAANLIEGNVASPSTMKSGVEYMVELADWYSKITADAGLGFFQIAGGIAGRLPDLRRADAPPGPAPHRSAVVELFLPDLGFHHQLRFVLGGRAQRKDHLGQARRRHAVVHHRVGCLDRRAVDLRLRSGW